MSVRGFVLVACFALIAGCGTPPKERYYTLSAAEAPARAASAKAAYTVSVGPVTVPEMVDRPQIVLRVAANRVEMSELNRWAEPLKRAIPRVVAANLAHELGSSNVFVHAPGEKDAEYRVLIDVERFESQPGKEVTIEASWSVRRVAKGEPRSGRSVVREPVAGAGYEALVAAHSRALEAVTRDIAEVLRTPSR